MKYGKLLPIVLFLWLACASYGIKKNTAQEQFASLGLVKDLRPVGIIGERKLGSSSLYLPTGIAIDLLGNIFITDTGNDRVVKCDQEGRFLTETGGFGWEAGAFNRPTYIATDNGLNVYVVDAQNKRIQRFDHNLNFVSTIEFKEEGGFSGLGSPEGIAITSSGEILVSDIEADHIIRLNSFFEFERSFGGFGEIQGGLRDPFGVFVSQDGNVYVADSQNDRVVIFDSFGNVLKSFGEEILSNPKAIAVGADRLIYVANSGENSLVVFDPYGNLVLEYGNSGTGIENLSFPTDLRLWKENKLMVVDSKNNRILIFELFR